MYPERQSGSSLPLLSVESLVKCFGSFIALDGLSFSLMPGEILGLVGPNGSGKTTCINVISGLYRADGGRVVYQGRVISGLPSHRLVHIGINRTFQVQKPFMTLTVRENVEVAATYGRRDRTGVDINGLLASLELDRYAEQPAAELNSVQQKMLDLARALATGPRLLCVDELAAGLNPTELIRVAEQLRDIAHSGVSLLVVEHLMSFIDQVTDRVIVLNVGREIFEGPLSEAIKNQRVMEVYLGAENDD